jgi:hypothetical protein
MACSMVTKRDGSFEGFISCEASTIDPIPRLLQAKASKLGLRTYGKWFFIEGAL